MDEITAEVLKSHLNLTTEVFHILITKIWSEKKLVIDWIMRKTEDKEPGTTWNMFDRLEDLEFADDMCLIASTKKEIQAKSPRLAETAQKVRLNINMKNTKLLIPHENDEDHIEIDRKKIEGVKEFCCLLGLHETSSTHSTGYGHQIIIWSSL
ncbi:hypothetical protein QE152_g37391 [Popillia japonica]|uniref:Reverse transcriptase domain-containing protein n=1 Tax=Popillia japonica TaxID=7064 RepID=A0AAW1IAL6_POPJA